MKLATKFKGKHLLLDTNILIYQLNGQIDISDDLATAESLNISAITESELYAGIAPAELLNLKDYLSSFRVIPVTSDIATLAGAYKSAMPHLGLKDLIIGATAEINHYQLVTADKKDFQGVTTISPIIIDLN